MTEHEPSSVEELLRPRRGAYEQLLAGARTLRAGPLYWTERALLRLVELVAEQRLAQFGSLGVGPASGRGEWAREDDLRDVESG